MWGKNQYSLAGDPNRGALIPFCVIIPLPAPKYGFQYRDWNKNIENKQAATNQSDQNVTRNVSHQYLHPTTKRI